MLTSITHQSLPSHVSARVHHGAPTPHFLIPYFKKYDKSELLNISMQRCLLKIT